MRLNRRNGALHPTGIFHCELPDITGTNRTLYIELYLHTEKTNGQFLYVQLLSIYICNDSVRYNLLPNFIGLRNHSITHMTYNDTTNTLVCTSTGGMVSIGRGSCRTQTPASFSQHIVDRVRARYENVVVLEPKDQGKYVCSVRNELKSSHAVLLTEYDVGKFVVSFCNYWSTHCTMYVY